MHTALNGAVYLSYHLKTEASVTICFIHVQSFTQQYQSAAVQQALL